ncbi:MAG TPA: LysE family transporter [Tepidisphaeraceae bacterium]|nr:LysE family transporter [Tepidisphaeraceae bacterium]
MNVVWLLASGMGLGLGAAAPVGPVNVEIARRTLRFGRRAGFALGCGAVTVDVAYAVVASVASVQIMEFSGVRTVIGVAGGLFLGYLAFLCFRGAMKATPSDPISVNETPDATPSSMSTPTPVPAAPLRGHYLHGLTMTALNPMTLVFWFVGVPGAVARLTENARADLPIVAAGVFAGALGWVCFFTWLIGHLGRFGRERWLRWVDLAGGVVLLAFAIGAIWRVLRDAL